MVVSGRTDTKHGVIAKEGFLWFKTNRTQSTEAIQLNICSLDKKYIDFIKLALTLLTKY